MTAFAGMAGVLAMGVGLLVLAGWWLRIEPLKRVCPGMISMNPVTAISAILAGLSLSMQVRNPVRLANVPALLIVAVGMLKLFGYINGWDFHVDQWAFPNELRLNEPVAASRIAPNTSAGLVFLGLALLAMDRGMFRGIRLAEMFAIALGMIALLAIVGYIYQARWLYGVATHVPMALHTAVTFLVLAIGIVFARPKQGIMAVVTADSTGGLLARRLFPTMVLVFVAAGALRIIGEHRGYYDAELGEALYTMVSIGLFGLFVLWSARTLHRKDLERTHIEKERAGFFELSVDLLGIAGMDGYFKRVNPAFTRTLGYSPTEILSRPFLDFVHPDDVRPTMGEMEKLSEGHPTLHFQNRYRCKDGSWKWLEWSTRPFIEEGIQYAVARDVTEKKNAEAVMLALNAELIQQTSRLEAVNLELESFSHSVSHDLRAPLRGIFGFAQAVEEHAAGSLDATCCGYLRRIRNAASVMGELIDDLLKLSRLTRAEMTMKTVDLSEMARSRVEGFLLADPEREAEVVIAPGIRVLGDPALIGIMLDNLLDNAWKFTSQKPHARIEVGAHPAEGGRVSCFIRDNGVGFDQRHAHKLFGAFQRLHALSEFKGTGIGLATVQRIVHRHGGEVSARGAVHCGATFEFSLEEPIKKDP